MTHNEYEKALFEAYIATPKSFDWYRKAFEHFERREGKMGWYWNSWAFLGGFWYFLYRRESKMAMIVLLVMLLIGIVVPTPMMLPLLLLLHLLIGGFGTYYVYKGYRKQKEEIEAIVPNEEKRLAFMRYQLGGVNRWAIPMAIFAFVSLVLIVIGLAVVAHGASTQAGSTHVITSTRSDVSFKSAV